jgi:hypothetical protein
MQTLEREDAILSVAFSADGAPAVTASKDGAARGWDAATEAPIGQLMRIASPARSSAPTERGW